MSRFDTLNKDMNKVLTTILGSQNLCKYLLYDDATPLTHDDIQDTSVILFDKVFPTPVVPQITEVAKSLITIVLDDFKPENIVIKDSKVVLSLLVHIDLWSMVGTGKLRPYCILNEIDKLFNNQNLLGIGNLVFESCRWIAPNEKWQGYQIVYKTRNLN